MPEERLSVAKSLAIESGAILRLAFMGEKIVTHKGRIDLLTNYDLQSEQILVEGIQNAFPEDFIVAEEQNAKTSRSEYWLVDPIDGTTNFTHGLPDFTICLAYLRKHEPVMGVIYNPARDELFSAVKNGGAFLNNEPIRVSDQPSLTQSLLAAGFPYDLDTINFDVFGYWHQIFYMSRGIRHIGCTSLNLAYIACGRLDGFWESGFRPWDIAAGMVIVREAGGIITRLDGGEKPLSEPCSILATNRQLHTELLELLNE